MNEKIVKRLAALLSVKSLVTLALTVTFVVLCMRGLITGQDFMTIFLIVVSFYFGTQTQKIGDAVGGNRAGTAADKLQNTADTVSTAYR